MFRKSLSILLSLSIVVTSQFSVAQEKPVDSRQEMVRLATALAENTFYVNQLKAQVEQEQAELAGSGDKGDLGTYTKFKYGTAAVLALASIYLATKVRKYQDIRGLFAAMFSGAFGLTAIGTAISGGILSLIGHNISKDQKNEISEKLKELQIQLSHAIVESNLRMAELRQIDPQIDAKVAAAVSNNSYRVERFSVLRLDLANLKNELASEKYDLGLSGFFAVSSVLSVGSQLIKSVRLKQLNKVELALNAAGVLAMGLWFNKNLNDRKEYIEQINVVEKNISGLEQEYKNALVQSIVGG